MKLSGGSLDNARSVVKSLSLFETLKYSSACCAVGPRLFKQHLGTDFVCSLSTGGLEADSHLEGVIDPPLETSEGSNHEDSDSET